MELKTKSNNGLYELWRTQEKNISLVNTFSLSSFSVLDWQINKDGNVYVSHWDGGPEGGDSTKIMFDHQGNEQTRIVQKNLPFSGDTFTFGTNPTYTVKYLTQESCRDQKLVAHQGAYSTTTIELRGISIRYGNNSEHDYLLSKPVPLECIPGDGAFMNPAIAIIDFNKDEVKIRLANQTTATILKTYNGYGGTSLTPTVTFKP